MDLEAEISQKLESFYAPEEAAMWWTSKQPFFEGAIPAQMLADGRGAELLEALKAMEDCVYL